MLRLVRDYEKVVTSSKQHLFFTQPIFFLLMRIVPYTLISRSKSKIAYIYIHISNPGRKYKESKRSFYPRANPNQIKLGHLKLTFANLGVIKKSSHAQDACSSLEQKDSLEVPPSTFRCELIFSYTSRPAMKIEVESPHPLRCSLARFANSNLMVSEISLERNAITNFLKLGGATCVGYV